MGSVLRVLAQNSIRLKFRRAHVSRGLVSEQAHASLEDESAVLERAGLVASV